MLVSACIIVKNEAHFLQEMINSIADAVDEIIIVDTGSTDDTMEIAKQNEVKIYYHPWNKNFSEVRNYAISKASGKWILSIDADEELETPLALREEIINSDENTGCLLVETLSPGLGNQGSFKAYLPRIFRNNEKIRFDGRIHEQVTISVLQNGFTIKPSTVKIFHKGYGVCPNQMVQKHLRNLELLNAEILSNKSNIALFFQRAKTYLALDKFDSAQNDIVEVIKNINPSNPLFPDVLNYASLISYKNGKPNLAQDLALKSLEINSHQIFANITLGDLFFEQKEYSKALFHYRQCMKIKETPEDRMLFGGDIMISDANLIFNIGKCLLYGNNTDEAIKYFSDALEKYPDDANILIELANACFKVERFEDALELFKQARMITKKSNELDKYIKEVEKFTCPSNIQINEKPRVSVSMIVRNEEKFLEDCLLSVEALAEEIVIVDTGSTDKTKEIAHKYGTKVFDYKWNDDFSAARNFALQHTTGDWVIYLDADERIQPGQNTKIMQYIERATENIGGFLCNIISPHYKNQNESEVHKASYPRIFRNLGYPKIKFTGIIHEQITPAFKELGLKFILTDIDIIHLGYNQDSDVIKSKVLRNYQMLMKEIEKHPTNGYYWYQIGQTLGFMKLFDQAIEAYKFAISCGNLSDSIYATTTASMAHMVGNRGDYNESLEWSLKSLEKAPNFLYAVNLKAYSLLYLNRFEEAENEFKFAIRLKQSKSQISLSGFEIEISDETLLTGLKLSQEKRVK